MEAWQELAIGLVCMVILGPAVGNYATSVVFRLPRGQTPFEKNPYCGNCNSFLQPEDLFPIWSYVLLHGKCRYCSITIPAIYTWVEVMCGFLFVGNYLKFGISEPFILLTSFGVFGIILAALEWQQNKLYSLILTYLFAIAALYRAVQDSSIYPAFLSGAVVLVVAAALWRVLAICGIGRRETVPAWLWLATLVGVLFPLKIALMIVGGMMAASIVIRFITPRPLWCAFMLGGVFGMWWLA